MLVDDPKKKEKEMKIFKDLIKMNEWVKKTEFRIPYLLYKLNKVCLIHKYEQGVDGVEMGI